MKSSYISYRTTLVYAIVAILLIHCSATKGSRIQGIQVTNLSPVMGETFYRIYYSDPYIVLQAPYSSDTFINDSTRKQEWKYSFYVFHSDSTFGYSFDEPPFYKKAFRVKADSILNIVRGTTNFDSALKRKPDTSYWSADKSIFYEQYRGAATETSPSGYIGFFFSKKLNHLRASLNSKVDSAKGMKLFKYEFVLDSFHDKRNNMDLPGSSSYEEMKEITAGAEVQEYIERYKKTIR